MYVNVRSNLGYDTYKSDTYVSNESLKLKLKFFTLDILLTMSSGTENVHYF